MSDIEKKLNEAQKKPLYKVDGKTKWVQNCYCCNKQINFERDGKNTYVVVGELVRHRKCYPGSII